MSTSRATTGRPGLRADIQGLRAVAVLTVIASHAGLGPLAGGFVGVDVFFVISGFLITQLLVREVERSGRVSLVGFYARRARRILPAATVVLVATAVASALWLGVVRAPAAITDAVWAAFFAVNVRLATEGTDYFAQDLPPSPVQHYWSLAVEEQFYLAWPLVMLAVVAVAARRRRRVEHALQPVGQATPYDGFLLAIAAITAASFVWSVVQTTASPTSAYFSSLTRAWELGLGALGAIWLARRASRPDLRAAPRGVVEALAGAGIVAIAVACLVYDEATPFPGWHAALPVAGSLLVLVAGGLGGGRSVVDRALGVRPMTLVGDWSYSLYLWHWPLLIIPPQYVGRDLRLGETLAVVALTFVLAGLTYRFVENPMRTASWIMPPWRAVAVYPATVALIVGAAVGAHAYVDRVGSGDAPAIALGENWRASYDTRDKAEALVKASVRAARNGHGIPRTLRPPLAEVRESVGDQGACDYTDDEMRDVCPRGDTEADRSIVVFGNSHGRHWISAFDKIAQEMGYTTYYFTKVQCIGSLVTPDTGSSSAPFTACVDFHEWALEQIAVIQPDLAVVSTSSTNRGVYDADGTYHTDRDEVDEIVKRGYVDLLDTLDSMADRTVMLLDIPRVDRDPATCLSSPRATLESCLMKRKRSHVASVRDQAAAAEEAGVRRLQTRQWFCLDRVCPTVIGDMLPYRDPGHMTNEYAEHLAPYLADRLRLKPVSAG